MASKKLQGITIEIDGNTTGLSNALKDVQSNISSTQSELKNLNSLLKLDPSNVVLLTQKQTLLSNAIASTEEKLKRLNEAKKQADTNDNVDKNTASYRELEREIAATEQQLKKYKQQTDDNNSALKGFGNTTDEAGNKTLKFGDIIKASLLSDAIKAGLKSLADGVKKVSSSFVDLMKTGVQYNAEMEKYKTAFTTLTGSAEEADKILQQIKKDAATTPFDVAGLTQANQLLISTGLDSSVARDTILALGDAISATGGGNEELSRMAVNLQQIQNVGKASSLDIKQFAYAGIDVYGLLADSMGITREEASQMDISFNDLSNALINASSQGGKYFQAMEKQSHTLNGQVSNLKDNFSSFAGVLAEDTTNAISGSLLPAVNDLIQGMTEGMHENGIQGMTQALTDGLMNIVNVVVEMLPSFIEMGIQIINGIVTGLSNNSTSIINSIMNAMLMIINAIAKMLPQILQLGLQIIVSLIQGITQNLPTIIQTIIDVVMALIQTILDNLPLIIETGVELLVALIEGIVDAIPKLLEMLPTIIVAINTALLKPDMLGKLISAGINLIISLGEGLIKAIPELLLLIPRIISSLFKEIKKIITETDWLQLGKNILNGILNGMLNFGTVVRDTIAKVGTKITDSIKSFFGIHSPSKLMKNEVGKYLAQGIAVGFEDEIPNTIDDVQNAMSELNSGIQSSLNPTINPSANSNPMIIQIDNFNNTRETDIQALAEELEFYRKLSATSTGGK